MILNSFELYLIKDDFEKHLSKKINECKATQH